MFINFGSGKCPLCGDFGKEMMKDVFHCMKCRLSFNDFYFSTHEMIEEEDKYWT